MSASVVDWERVRGLCEDDPVEIRELIALTVTVVREILHRLELALARSDGSKVRSELHELRGSSANAGADEVAALAGDLEDALRTGRMADGDLDLSLLHGAVGRLAAAELPPRDEKSG